jgi:hypothetical protein
MAWTAEDFWFDFQQRSDIFFFLEVPRSALESPYLLSGGL